jgi:hypothetical protein
MSGSAVTPAADTGVPEPTGVTFQVQTEVFSGGPTDDWKRLGDEQKNER